MGDGIVITGVGMLTPLGDSPERILDSIAADKTAFQAIPWPSAGFSCPVYAPIPRLVPEEHVPESKTIRLMSRDAILAVGAARLAIRDSNLIIGADYAPDEIGLFGSTGMAGMALSEIAKLVEAAADSHGGLDLKQFGSVALRQVRPVLSFKILSNMPLCFVSIFEGIQGVNAAYSPWEGQGAHAIAGAIAAIRRGDASCALVGGCDVKTHELGFLALEQAGALRSWRQSGNGSVPGEGAAFLVLEDARHANKRGARVYARIRAHALATLDSARDRAENYLPLLDRVHVDRLQAVLPARDGDSSLHNAENEAMERAGIRAESCVRPKANVGDLFAAAAAVQVALAAAIARGQARGVGVLGHCLGFGSEQAIFLLESP